jgi:hypothetical protein
MRPGVSSMIPKQKDKASNGAHQALQKTITLISKAKKQSGDGHILQQSGNHSQRICSTRSDGE